MDEELTGYLNGRKPKEFRSGPIYSADGDFLCCYLRDDDAYAERVDELLTIYRSMEDRELVGCKIKGVRRILDKLGNFGVEIESQEGVVQLNLLFLAAASLSDASKHRYYEEMGRYVKDVAWDMGGVTA